MTTGSSSSGLVRRLGRRCLLLLDGNVLSWLPVDASHHVRHVSIIVKGDHDARADHLAVDPDALVLYLLRLHQLGAWAMGHRLLFGGVLDASLVDKSFFLIDEIVLLGDIFVGLNRNEI